MRVPRKVKANVFKFSFKFLKGILGLRLFVKHFLSQRAKCGEGYDPQLIKFSFC